MFRKIFTTLLLTAIIANLSFAQSKNSIQPVFAKETPIWVDFDMENIAEPKEVETGYLYDWSDNTIFRPFRKGFGLNKLGGKKEALNINTWDEVPDSSWFTNRIGMLELSPEDIKRGANTSSGPVAGELTVVKGKSTGVTPGFWIKDKTGAIYILKFDPPENPELASGAEMISTKLFHAIGYNVPENYIFRFRREDLKVSEKASFKDDANVKRKMTEADLDSMLSRVARQPDGSYRALASKLINGKPKGGFTFAGVREDDKNDIIPHQYRRDLRGLRVFSAWLEHNDIRVGNTLDVYVEQNGRKFLKHYLIDFGSTLGSDTVRPNEPIVGREHQIDYKEAGKVLLTAGIYQPKWRDGKNDPVFSSAVGRYSTKFFNPINWKQNFPLEAFEAMTDRDAFWAARIIARFTPEQIRAAVESAEYSDPKDAEYLVNQLLERQRMIVEAYSNRGAGIGNFKLKKSDDSYSLSFTDFRNFTERKKAEKYFYRIKEAGKKGKMISQGEILITNLTLDSETIRQIHESNFEESAELMSVAELTLTRPRDKKEAKVYLYGKTPETIAVIGIIQ